jgi:phosphohistidine phosphatase
MKFLLIRHAHAIDQEAGIPDDARHLTATGRAAALAVGERLRREGHAFDALVTSPLVRAVQTAELVASAARYTGEVIAVTALAPGHSIRKAAEALDGLGEVVAAVGHEPSISALAAHLAGRSSHPPLKKAQVVVIDRGKVVAVLDHGER